MRKCKALLYSGLLPLLFIHFTAVAQAPAPDAKVMHIVYCWLKADTRQNRQRLMRQTQRLNSVNGVMGIRFGRPIPSSRRAVDSSYHLGIVFYLRNRQALTEYLRHPLHKAIAASTLKPLTTKVKIYDVQLY